MRIIIDLTGLDHEPTATTKWYAQVFLVTWNQIPPGVSTYQFGSTPEEALENLVNHLKENNVEI